KTYGNIEFVTENTEYPICVYPTKEYLKENRDLSEFGYAKYTSALALAEPQLSFRFFETDVLERYSNDPRFDFEFNDFSGRISCKYDESGKVNRPAFRGGSTFSKGEPPRSPGQFTRPNMCKRYSPAYFMEVQKTK